jgi:hypothetical protein
MQGERSWYIKADADAPRSAQSWGSAFQARRAIDALLDTPQATTNGTGKAKKKRT